MTTVFAHGCGRCLKDNILRADDVVLLLATSLWRGSFSSNSGCRSDEAILAVSKGLVGGAIVWLARGTNDLVQFPIFRVWGRDNEHSRAVCNRTTCDAKPISINQRPLSATEDYSECSEVPHLLPRLVCSSPLLGNAICSSTQPQLAWHA